ncbi:MAG: hypothetical protein K2G03_00515 [Bacilli bacterium]|nr:hypothetical protein [Bacilli bacterium]
MGNLINKIKNNVSEIALGVVLVASAGIITWSFVSNATNVNANSNVNNSVTEQQMLQEYLNELESSGVPAGMYISSTGDIGYMDMEGNYIEE